MKAMNYKCAKFDIPTGKINAGENFQEKVHKRVVTR
jgi:hypothetical protein